MSASSLKDVYEQVIEVVEKCQDLGAFWERDELLYAVFCGIVEAEGTDPEEELRPERNIQDNRGRMEEDEKEGEDAKERDERKGKDDDKVR